MKKTAFFFTPALILGINVSSPVMGNEYEEELTQLAQEQLIELVNNPEVIAAIKAQNAEHADLTEADIIALDKQWREQVVADSSPLIDGIMSKEISKFLSIVQEESDGLYSEIFLMDNHGLNVGQSMVTSDYWQGDEDKWQQTFLMGKDAIHISEIEEDESSQTFQSQISMSIVDTQTNMPIGAITVGINMEAL